MLILSALNFSNAWIQLALKGTQESANICFVNLENSVLTGTLPVKTMVTSMTSMQEEFHSIWQPEGTQWREAL